MIPKAGKEDIVRRLLLTRQKAASLRARLRLLGQKDDAATIADQISNLDDKIEDLIEGMMETWQGNSTARIEDISAANRKIQETIRGIKNRKIRAQQIVKAIGLIDGVIGIAASFL